MKKQTLVRVSYLLEIDEDLLKDDEKSRNFQLLLSQKLSKDVDIDDSHTAEWNMETLLVLDPLKMNCGKCVKCGIWTTDKECVNYIDGLANGAVVNNELLCDDCLPKGHRWAF